MKHYGALFDLDGVLIDTEGTYTTFWNRIDDAFPTHVPHFAQIIKGSNLDAILNTYFKKEDRLRIVEMLNDFQRDMRYEYFDGAMPLVDALRQEGLKCCVVTSSDQKKMEALYQQKPDFASHFDAVVTGEMVTAPKPAPECFILGARLIGCEPRQCLVFEDSFNGLAAGMASGATVVGLATTNPRASLHGKCHHLFDTIAQAHHHLPTLL